MYTLPVILNGSAGPSFKTTVYPRGPHSESICMCGEWGAGSFPWDWHNQIKKMFACCQDESASKELLLLELPRKREKVRPRVHFVCLKGKKEQHGRLIFQLKQWGKHTGAFPDHITQIVCCTESCEPHHLTALQHQFACIKGRSSSSQIRSYRDFSNGIWFLRLNQIP